MTAAWERELDDLVRHRGAALVGYAYLLCGDRREAEDLVQDSLVKTFTRGRAGLRADNLEGYVRRAVLTTYLDGFRRRRRWAAVRHLLADPDAAPPAVDRVDARHDGVRRLEAELGPLPESRAAAAEEDVTVTLIGRTR
jgi:RNA polymerase sigma-70 factor (ECF subfamily)